MLGWFLAPFFSQSPPFLSILFFLFFELLGRHGRIRQVHVFKVKPKGSHTILGWRLFLGVFRRQHFRLGDIPIVHGHHAAFKRQNKSFLEAHATSVGDFDLDIRDFAAVEHTADVRLGFLGFLIRQRRRRRRASGCQ